MSLWESLSGQTYHWNTTKVDANREVCHALGRLTDTQISEDDFAASLYVENRNYCYAFYESAEAFFNESFSNGSLSMYRKAIFSLSPCNYKRLVCAMHMKFAMDLLLVDMSDTHRQVKFDLQTLAITVMYDRATSYRMTWLDRLEWFGDQEFGPSRLMFKCYDEIAPILQLPENSVELASEWSKYCLDIASVAHELYLQPDYAESAEREICFHK